MTSPTAASPDISTALVSAAAPAVQRPGRPLVSILIPTHDRVDYLALALRSAQAQTYEHLQIVISDNSEHTDTRALLATQIESDPRVEYVRQEGGNYMENWLRALGQARGEYVNFLMDDDLFDPRKVERMLGAFALSPQVSLVTSFRQLIDGHGAPLAALPGTQRLFEQDTVLVGQSLAEMMIKSGMNLVGEPTTAMVRRADLGACFGWFCGHQYMTLSDLATWMDLLCQPGRYAVYLPEPLSLFRLHGGQDQRRPVTALRSNIEWLQLLVDGYQAGRLFNDPAGQDALRSLLADKLSRLVPFLAAQHAEIRSNEIDVDSLQRLLRRAFQTLWH